MKHPALTRVLAVVLAVLCLVMLLAGTLGITKARSDRRKNLDDAARLRDRIEEYHTVSLALEGAISYDEANKWLEAKQETHDKDAAQHRIDVATYTATQSGLIMGEEALNQADAQLAQGRAMYEQGKAEFEKQEKAFQQGYEELKAGKKQLEDGLEQLENYVDMVGNVRALLANVSYIADVLADENVESQEALLASALAACDGAVAAIDQATELVELLKAQGGVSAEQMETLIKLLEEETGQSLEDIPVREITAEDLEQWEQAAVDATGMTPAELKQEILAARSAVAAGSVALPLPDERLDEILTAYREHKDWIVSAIGSVDAVAAQAEEKLNENLNELRAMYKELEKAEALMEQGKAGIEQGRKALQEAGSQIAAGASALEASRAELWRQLAQQRDKLRELREERERLIAEAQKLKEQEKDAQARKDMEQRELSLRLMLLDREGIADRVDAGMELEAASLGYVQQLESESDYQYHDRALAYALMIAGAVLGFAGIPAAFERWRSRFLLIVPVLLCLLCAAAAEFLCLRLGRGSSYSALAVGIFALLQLALVIPRKKARPRAPR